jgi:chaperonin GroES
VFSGSLFGGKDIMSSECKIRPLQDRLIVKRLDNTEKTASGLYIPDTAQEKPQQGKVIAAGKGKVKEDGNIRPMDVKVGDIIIFGKYSGQEIKVDGEEYLIMKEDDVYGVLEK